VEYAGELLKMSETRFGERFYGLMTSSSFMFYFSWKDKKLCVDATEETGRLGRLVNHSRNVNLIAKVFEVDKTPRLIFIASREITQGSELTWDYGDRSKKSIEPHTWLAL
jgi:histone-lysine N-methyltransferase SETD8